MILNLHRYIKRVKEIIDNSLSPPTSVQNNEILTPLDPFWPPAAVVSASDFLPPGVFFPALDVLSANDVVSAVDVSSVVLPAVVALPADDLLADTAPPDAASLDTASPFVELLPGIDDLPTVLDLSTFDVSSDAVPASVFSPLPFCWFGWVLVL